MADRNSRLKESLGRFMTALCDLMLLNILWLLCSLPVITAGPATCAMMAVLLKLARDEGGGTVKGFFRAFQANFKNAFLLGLLVLFLGVVVYSDIVYALALEGSFRIVFLIVSGILCACILTLIVYAFALQARFENSLTGHLRNAFLLAFCNPGKTVALWLLAMLPAAILLMLPQYVVVYAGSLLVLFGVSAPMYGAAHILRGIFDRFAPQQTPGNGETPGTGDPGETT